MEQETFYMSVDFIKQAVALASEHRKQLRIGYIDKKGNVETRFVEPYPVENPNDKNFSAYCNLRKDFRHFTYDRVVRIVVTDFDQKHERKEAAAL